MTIERFWAMPFWILSALAFGLQIDTLYRAMWRRRLPGLRGAILLTYRSVTLSLLFIVIPLIADRRASIMLSAYGWFRRIDDVVDGEGSLPKGQTILSYCQQKKGIFTAVAFSSKYEGACAVEDLLLVHVLRASVCWNIDLRDEFATLLELIQFDAKRRTQARATPATELRRYAIRQDVCFLSAFAKIFGRKQQLEQPVSTIESLQGLFTRSDWLDDLPNDMHNGMINIPAEVVQQGGGLEELQNSTSFRKWHAKEIKELRRYWENVGHVFVRSYLNTYSSRLVARLMKKRVFETWEKACLEPAIRIKT